MRALRFLAPLLLLAATGCSSPKHDAENVIRSYDAALVKAFASGSPAPLKEVAGAKELRKVGTLIEYKGSAALVLESQLLDLKLDSCSEPVGDVMTATTTERWRYYDRSLKPGTPPGKTIESEMKLKYLLRREGGIWKVEKVEGISHQVLSETR